MENKNNFANVPQLLFVSNKATKKTTSFRVKFKRDMEIHQKSCKFFSLRMTRHGDQYFFKLDKQQITRWNKLSIREMFLKQSNHSN